MYLIEKRNWFGNRIRRHKTEYKRKNVKTFVLTHQIYHIVLVEKRCTPTAYRPQTALRYVRQVFDLADASQASWRHGYSFLFPFPFPLYFLLLPAY